MGKEEARDQKILRVTRSQHSIYLVDSIFSKPVFKSSDFIRQFSDQRAIRRQTAFDLLKRLRDAEILQELRPGRGSRSAVKEESGNEANSVTTAGEM